MAFTVDFHVHTALSYDSLQSPERVAERASAVGLDAVAITDHDEYGAHRRVRRHAADLLVIPGTEVRTDDYDDLLGLFVEGPIGSGTFREAVAEIHAHGGVAVLPHPYRKVERYPDGLLEATDAIEAINARSKSSNNDAAAALTKRTGATCTAGSDAHTPWEIGRARTEITVPVSGLDDLRAAVLDGATRPAGEESPYYLSHGLSLAAEAYKRVTGR